jgi:two-component system, NtrC family, response regulator GlrR
VLRQECFPWVQSAVATLRSHEALSRLVGEAPQFLATIERLPSIARNNATVVITGETGTGKELISRALHYLGPRSPHPFVPINCGALPDTLLEDELFGHERGAFTDAKARRTGLLAHAEQGTLFLDEVDSLTPRAQVALLRVLQGGTYRALGGNDERPVNVRFIAATNTSLVDLVRAGRFRGDLYYRLCVLAIDLPPLRERAEDILLLARRFLKKYEDGSVPRQLSADAERALLSYAWPGNVRELENVIQRSIAMTPAAVIIDADLGLPAHTSADRAVVPATPPALTAGAALPPFSEAKRAVVDAFERGYLQQILRAHRGNVSRAAQSARKERRDFGRLLKKHHLDPRSF